MNPNLPLIHPHTTEDKAISSLLEIDLKDQQEQPSWIDQKKFAQLGQKHRVIHKNQINPMKQKSSYKNKQKKHYEQHSQRLSFNPQMLQPNNSEENELGVALHDQGESRDRENKQKKINEGEYWSSKVNWMSQSEKQQVRSQPKLSKKFSFGYQINLRQTWKGNNSRFKSDEKSRRQEYKANLIYSILSGEAEALRVKHLQQKSKMISNRSCESYPRHNVKKQINDYDSMTKKQSYNINISKNTQDTMIKTLKNISARSYQDGPIFNQNPNNKHSEMQRAAMVRQMLQNIELAKDRVHVIQSKQDQKETKVGLKHQQQIVDDIMQLFVDQMQKIKQKSNILNLNLQAEKIYKGKTVCRSNGRRIIQELKLQ